MILTTIQLVIVALSGTRGYILYFAVGYPYLLYLYFFCKYTTVSRSFKSTRLAVFIIMCSIVMVVFIMNMDIILPKLNDIFRVSESLGTRDSENLFVKNYLQQSPIRIKLTGVGMGSNGSEAPYFTTTVINSFGSFGEWGINKYLHTNGIFHNFYYTVLYKQGFLGLCLIGAILVTIAKNIVDYFKKTDLLIPVLVYFMIYLFVLRYRWSAGSGLPEVMIISYFFYRGSKK